MIKKFKFNKDFKGTKTEIEKGSEARIQIIKDTEYIMDGCFGIFELDSDMARKYGEVVYRLW